MPRSYIPKRSRAPWPIWIAVALAVALSACETRLPDVRVVREKVCPVALTADELNRAADAIDSLPQTPELDYLAGLIDRFDDATMECLNAPY